jgi:hypothetical protein
MWENQKKDLDLIQEALEFKIDREEGLAALARMRDRISDDYPKGLVKVVGQLILRNINWITDTDLPRELREDIESLIAEAQALPHTCRRNDFGACVICGDTRRSIPSD